MFLNAVHAAPGSLCQRARTRASAPTPRMKPVMKLLLFSGSMGGGRHRALSMLILPKDTAAVAAAAKVKRSQPLPRVFGGRRAQEVEGSPQLVYLSLSWEEDRARQQLRHDAPEAPAVDLRGKKPKGEYRV